jgi:hypothetical protein
VNQYDRKRPAAPAAARVVEVAQVTRTPTMAPAVHPAGPR